jgi:hypothetical protein
MGDSLRTSTAFGENATLSEKRSRIESNASSEAPSDWCDIRLWTQLPKQLLKLDDKDLLAVQRAVGILLQAGLCSACDLPSLHASLAAHLKRQCKTDDGTADSDTVQLPIPILPDLVRTHITISAVANRTGSLSRLEASSIPDGIIGGRRWMLYLMPIWDWQTVVPEAQEFWKLAHAVARDHSEDDWIAPHMTLHSRSNSVTGLADKFCGLADGLGSHGWQEVREVLADADAWCFDEDSASPIKPSNHDHHVLHKAKIDLPARFRDWLKDNQDQYLPPRKQDKGKRKVVDGEKVPVTAPFHVSLYSFRAQRQDTAEMLPSPEQSPRIVNQRQGKSLPLDVQLAPTSDQLSSSPVFEPTKIQRKLSYQHAVPAEQSLACDLARADWMLVFVSPGSTGKEASAPLVLRAARLTDLARGS